MRHQLRADRFSRNTNSPSAIDLKDGRAHFALAWLRSSIIRWCCACACACAKFRGWAASEVSRRHGDFSGRPIAYRRSSRTRPSRASSCWPDRWPLHTRRWDCTQFFSSKMCIWAELCGDVVVIYPVFLRARRTGHSRSNTRHTAREFAGRRQVPAVYTHSERWRWAGTGNGWDHLGARLWHRFDSRVCHRRRWKFKHVQPTWIEASARRSIFNASAPLFIQRQSNKRGFAQS